MATFSDETLMRYVDGELDEPTCVEIEAALDADAELGARIDLFARTGHAAREALKPMLDEPVPESLRASVEAMVAGSRRSAPKTITKWRMKAGSRHIPAPANDWWRLAAAACVAGLLGVAGGYMAADRAAAPGLRIADVDPDALATVLATAPSGGERTLPGGAARFRAIASFRSARDSLCREFELDMDDSSKLTSVACDESGEWRVRFVASMPGEGAGYVPASSAESVDAFLTAIEAGEPLSPDDERLALEKRANPPK